MRRRYRPKEWPRSTSVRRWSLERTVREYTVAASYFEALRPAQRRVVSAAVLREMRAAIASRPTFRLYDPTENVTAAKIRRIIEAELASIMSS